MKMKPAALGALLLLMAVQPVSADQERPEVGPYVYAYSGDFNSSVHIVRLGKREEAEALVLINGIDHELDGKVLKTIIQARGENQRSYMLKNGDEVREIMRLEGNSGRLFVSSAPFGPTSYALSYNGDLSRSVEAQHILTRWLQDP